MINREKVVRPSILAKPVILLLVWAEPALKLITSPMLLVRTLMKVKILISMLSVVLITFSLQ